MTLPRVRSVDREPIVYNDNELTRVQTCDIAQMCIGRLFTA